MRSLRSAAACLPLLLGMAIPAAADQAESHFQLAILAQDWFDLGGQYDWEGAWPRLQAAAAKPLFTIDEHDVEAYDWAAQRIVLRPEVTPRFLERLQTLPNQADRLRKLRALWDSSDLRIALDLQGFVVSFDGKPLYGGIFQDKYSQMSNHYPVLHAALNEDRRIVLRFSPIHYPFGSLWDDGTTGDALDSPTHPFVAELQDAFGQAFPEMRTASDYLSSEDQELVARFKRLILDSRIQALFKGLAVPVQAPQRPERAAKAPVGSEGARPQVALNSFRVGDGWELLVDLGDPESVAEIRLDAEGYRLRFRPDEYQTRIEVPPQWLTPGRHRLEVRLVDFAGVESAPYIEGFDPEKEVLLHARHDLSRALYRWATFRTGLKCDGTCLDFTTALSHRDALREIRYSFGNCGLDQRFPFEPWTDLAESPSVNWDDKTSVPVPQDVSQACVQLVYRDGETTEPQVYSRRPGPENSWGPAETLKDAQPPAARSAGPVSLRTWRYGTGWEMAFDVEDREALSDILYRFDDAPKWLSTGLYPRRSPRTGRYHPSTLVPISPRVAKPGRHRLDIRLVDLDGKESGPYTFWFDPQQEVLAEARSHLSNPEEPFAAFSDSGPEIDNTTLYFGDLIDRRDALREIRYSIDSCALDQRIPFTPWDDLAHAPAATCDSWLHFPKSVSYACFQWVYRDGEVSEPKRIEHRPGE